MKPITVAICTHNPAPALLNWALSSLDCQTLERDRFNVLIVDNASNKPLDQHELGRARRLDLTVIREERKGLIFARLAAILNSQSPVVVLMDDDNYFAPDYLEQALRIAESEPQLGAFGGKAFALVPDLESPWMESMLPHFGVRDYGDEPIVSNQDEWGFWQPIGAGCVFRRDVGQKFTEVVERNERSHALGRRGLGMMSGEDALLARCAYRIGLQCAYQPELTLWHYIKPSRLSYRTIARTMYGHGRSHVRLERVLDKPLPRASRLVSTWELVRRLPYRAKTHGWHAGLAHWCWDIGYYLELFESVLERRADFHHRREDAG